MKLLTLNCHSWQEENQIEKIRYIAKVIDEIDYDVIAFQEVNQRISSEIIYKNIKKDNFCYILLQELNKLNNYKYDFYWDISHIGYDIYEEGLCIMTKLPIIKTDSFIVSNRRDINFWKTRKVVKLDTIYKQRNISFLCCHLGWWDDCDESFINQANNVIEISKNEELMFVMGDFNNNANTKNEGYDYLSNELIDTYTLAKKKDSGITVNGKIEGWEENKKDLRLDMIFVNKEIEVEKSKVIFNDINKNIVSDHYGVEVKVNI